MHVNWADTTYSRILRLIHDQSGLEFRPEQQASVTTAAVKIMQQMGIERAEHLPAALLADRDSMTAFIELLTIGETFFFREPKHFEFIRDEVFPEIIPHRSTHRPMRIWSAACSSGEEAYSLAMLAAQQGLEDRVRILATDISHDALRRARLGRYRKWSLRGEAEKRTRRFLSQEGDQYVVDPNLAKQIRFQFLNLATSPYPDVGNGTAQQDLILCRNVLIYFSPSMIKMVTRRLVECLADGGVLITASGDPPLDRDLPVELISNDRGFFYRSLGVKHDNTLAKPSRFFSPATTPPRNPQPPIDPVAPENRTNPAQSAPSPDPSVSSAAASNKQSLASYLHDLKLLATKDVAQALKQFPQAIAEHALSPELHYRYALLLFNSGRTEDAFYSVQRAVFLDRSLVDPHFLLGTIQQRRGNHAAAWRQFRNARDLSRELGKDAILPLSERTAAEMMETAQRQMDQIEVTHPI